MFLKACGKVGFNQTTGRLYWKMFFTVLFKNPRAMEMAVTLAVLYMHFNRQSGSVIDVTNKKIKYIESIGEENFNQSMLPKTVLL
jgi:hypothetical protein